MHRAWLATGFDPGSARALGVRTALADRVLLAAVAVAVVVSLDAVGALLVAVVLVVPAATVRLRGRRRARAAGSAPPRWRPPRGCRRC